MHPLLALGLASALGLCIGSFLNVVISRLPVMMMRQWHIDALETLDQEVEELKPFNLAVPRSLCPGCESPIAWHDNVPLLGYLKRKGRCANCSASISVQYPLVEIAGALLAAGVILIHGASLESLFLLGALLALLTLAVIDFHTQLLPDIITLPLLWAGLAFHALFQPDMLQQAVIGAMGGYLVLWSVFWIFKLATGKTGMGYGDFKLMAALGAWLGWAFIPYVLVIAAFIGASVGIVAQLAIPRLRGEPIPFGPFLAIGGGLCLFFGEALIGAFQGMLTL
ncbi:prepilin peptidase [Vreelandella rituensis]|uniref:Prepilin leader peptidase/N-methyltransferase n=1 Tax=Vreelandella rituensis TaxID=2282306 RepID=A0A368UA66_9GAMM|nr:A24 family peptidase [Halomonas rituensis]RCV93925.1 prepilin peptidase [Halomonas rituensis]